MIKDDQRGTRNPYKCMNVMKQDAMDDKIKERCKTCEKHCMQEDLDRLRAVEMLSSQPRWIESLLRIYQAKKKFLDQSIDLAIKRCRDYDKKQLKSSIDKLGIERC